MQTKSFYTVSLLIFFWLPSLLAQTQPDSLAVSKKEIIDELDKTNILTDSIVNDTLIKKEPTLLDKVKYKASDYVRINRKENKLYLYNEAELYYQDIELKAGIIILDYAVNEVTEEELLIALGILVRHQISNKTIVRLIPTPCVLISTLKKH